MNLRPRLLPLVMACLAGNAPADELTDAITADYEAHLEALFVH